MATVAESVNATHSTEPLPWQSLEHFTASTTLSEKVWRVVNNLIFAAGGIAILAIASKKILHAPPALQYACYAALALLVRTVFAYVIGRIVYPATFYWASNLEKLESTGFEALRNEEFIIQKITLYKSGVGYDATLIGHKDTITNGKWSMHALGNGMAMEELLYFFPRRNYENGANTLLINGPDVGRSGGYPTRYQMGAGFEAGFQFLEKEVKATHVAFEGWSLGGGMLSEASLSHEFDTSKVKYLAISDRTFSRLSDIAAAFVPFIARPAFFLTGTELDGISGAEKLKELNIEHIIIQHESENNLGTDAVIPDRVGLEQALEKTPTRIFLQSPHIHHVMNLPYDIALQLNNKIKDFFQKP